MKVNLRIERMTIEMPEGRSLDPGTVKSAIERELAARIKAGGAPGIGSGVNKSVTNSTRPSGPRGDTHVAENVATRIYEATKR